MYRNYYSYSDMPTIAKPSDAHCEKKPEPKPEIQDCKKSSDGFLQNLSADDLILLAVIFILLQDGCDDTLLLLAIGYIFISAFF